MSRSVETETALELKRRAERAEAERDAALRLLEEVRRAVERLRRDYGNRERTQDVWTEQVFVSLPEIYVNALFAAEALTTTPTETPE